MNTDGLSTEAKAFLDSCVQDNEPTDFSRIMQIRDEVRETSVPGAERAIRRHDLLREDIVLAGVDCERIVSCKNKATNGTLVYFFGGGFVVGCPYSDLPIIGALAQWCQLEVIAPKYRLAPEHPAPAAADDCMSVWREVSSTHAQPLFLAGESAGGNLALVVAQRALSEGLKLPDAMALLSPAVGLRTDVALFEPTTYADPTLSPVRVGEVLRVYGENGNANDPSLSPLFGSLTDMPPVFITTGTRDMLLSMCLRLHRELIRAGVEVECRVWDGLWHVFEYYDEYPEAAESLREISSFLNERA